MCSVLYLVVSNEIRLRSSLWVSSTRLPSRRRNFGAMSIYNLFVEGVITFV